MIVNGKDLLKKALKDGYAIPAYNINNLEWTRFILEACQEDRSPVILAVTPSAINYFGGFKTVVNIIKGLITDLNITAPVVIHLDHAKDFYTCKCAIDNGFSSVMIDESDKSLDDNIDLTNKVIEYASKKDIMVEAEIGSMNVSNNYMYASVDDCSKFVISTGVDILAPSIGNKHGVYVGEPNIDFDLLGSICKATKIPLVLHGASGLNDNKIKTAIFCGVSKININTDLQIAWSDALKDGLNNDPSLYDPRKIIKLGEKALKDKVHEKNILFGSKNKFYG